MHLRIISYIFSCIQRPFFFYQNTWEKGMKDRVAFIRSIHSQRRNSSLSVEGNHCQRRKISVTVSLGTQQQAYQKGEAIPSHTVIRIVRKRAFCTPIEPRMDHLRQGTTHSKPFLLFTRTSRKRWIYIDTNSRLFACLFSILIQADDEH